MTMVAKVFKNGRSQAIRIPKEYKKLHQGQFDFDM